MHGKRKPTCAQVLEVAIPAKHNPTLMLTRAGCNASSLLLHSGDSCYLCGVVDTSWVGLCETLS